MSRQLFLSSAIALAVLAAAVFTVRGAPDTKKDDAAVKTVRIGSIAYPGDGKPEFTGDTALLIQEGWLEAELKKRGIALEWVPIPTAVGGPLVNEGFANKRIDFASYGDFPSIIANAGGIETRVIVPIGRGQDSYLIVRNGLEARSIADLKGKRVALHRGRPWELPFSKLLEANGLTLADFKLFNLNPQAAAAALAAGEIDATFALSDALLLEEKGIGRVIWSTREAPPEWKMRAELYGRKDFVEAHPDITQIVATAHVRAAHWSSLPENRQAVIEIRARSGTPISVVERDLDDPRVAWKDRFSPLFDEFLIQHYRYAADYTHATKLVPVRIDVDRLLGEQRFVAAALKELNLETYWQPAGR